MNPKNHHHRRGRRMVYAMRRSSSCPNVREDAVAVATPPTGPSHPPLLFPRSTFLQEDHHRHNPNNNVTSPTDQGQQHTHRNATWAATSLWESSQLCLPEMGPDRENGPGVVPCPPSSSSASLLQPPSSSSMTSMRSLRSLQIADLLQQALDLTSTALEFSQGTMDDDNENEEEEEDDDIDSCDSPPQ